MSSGGSQNTQPSEDPAGGSSSERQRIRCRMKMVIGQLEGILQELKEVAKELREDSPSQERGDAPQISECNSSVPAAPLAGPPVPVLCLWWMISKKQEGLPIAVDSIDFNAMGCPAPHRIEPSVELGASDPWRIGSNRPPCGSGPNIPSCACESQK
ncbi:UPF0583 protein C15orf59 [Chelonia mydas]|uniref:Inhibitory synaptic factor 1 n=1 Tax=Chelonia mydas TaxID=8469 RepID=M7BES9_CHEMY|nr:UPF0583 protein C15orf59 [Chelonia mydas]